MAHRSAGASQELDANVFRANPTPAVAERPGCYLDADGVVEFGTIRRPHGSCSTHGDDRVRTGFCEDRMRHDLIRLVVIARCIFDETKATIPNEDVGVRVDRLQEDTLSDRRLADVGALRLRWNSVRNCR